MGNKKNCQQFIPAINDGVSLLSKKETLTRKMGSSISMERED